MADPNATPSVLSLPNPDYEGPLGGEGAAAYMRAIGAHDVAAKKQEGLAKRFEERRPKEEAESERAYAGAERAAAQPRPPVPQMERVESPPKPEDYQKMSMGYLGAMVLLGAFGGKFIRNAANAPLAAFNGALTGWQEGNMEAYKEKSAEWKEKQQQVLDNNRARLDEYRTILEDRNASIQDQMLRVKLTAAKHQDKMMYDRADAENWTGVAQAYDQGVAVHEKAVAATDKIVEQLTTQNETSVERANQWKAHLETPQGQQQFNQMTPAQQMQVKGFINTYADQAPAAAAAPAHMPPDLRAPPTPAIAQDEKKSAWRQLRIKAWNEHGSEPTPEEEAAHNAAMHQPRSIAGMDMNAFVQKWRVEHGGQEPPPEERIKFQARRNAELSGASALGRRVAAVEFSAQEFDNMMPIMQRTSDAVARKKFVPYNRLKNMALEGTSNVPFKEFKNAVAGGITAYAGTMSRSGATTVYAQHRADEVLGLADSKEAFNAGMKILKQEVDAVRAAGPQTLATLERIFGASGIDPKVRPELEQAAGRGGKPAQVEQGGYIYRLGPDGEYHPADEEE